MRRGSDTKRGRGVAVQPTMTDYRGYTMRWQPGGRTTIRSHDSADVKIFNSLDKARTYIDQKENK